MSQPGVWIETVGDPVRYSQTQIDYAALIAWHLNRGRFVLAEPPRRA